MKIRGIRLSSKTSSFRLKLMLTMMLVTVFVTVVVLILAERNAAGKVTEARGRDFEGRLGFLLGSKEARRTMIMDYCKALAGSTRIRAALEQGNTEDLYRNAEVELRDVLPASGNESHARWMRVESFRFLNAEGALIPKPGSSTEQMAEWEKQLIAPDGHTTDGPRIRYLVAPRQEGGESIQEMIAMPIVTTENGKTIGYLCVCSEPLGKWTLIEKSQILNAIWLDGRVDVLGGDARINAHISRICTPAIQAADAASESVPVLVRSQPHLLFFRQLEAEPGSPLAYQLCLYPQDEALKRQRLLRANILGGGGLVLLCGLLASHIVSARLSEPVEKLEQDSRMHLVEREKAEAALVLTEQKYRSIFENAVEGIFLLSPDEHFLSANPAMARIFGFDSAAQFLAEVNEPRKIFAEPTRLSAMIENALQDSAVVDFEAEMHRRDGEMIWVSQNLRAVRNTAGILVHFEGTLQNITERKRAADEMLVLNAELQAALGQLKTTQDQVIQQERLRALGQMASGIAHDFNNALVPILGFCELLLINPAILTEKKKALAYLETIQTAAKDASSVVARLREFYRAGKGDQPFAALSLKRLAEQAVTLTKPKWKDQAQANGATIQVALELDTLPPIVGDESALREVLTNLIFNAVDAMPDGGVITLRTRREGESGVIEVSDTGMGMTEEVRKRCLEPFFSTKGERGTGLGLSMVFGIVQRHSGKLEIHSRVGAGSTFVLTFPLQDAATEKAVLKANALPRRPLRVLVVDDEAPVRDTLAAVLTSDGHEVDVATDGFEGLQQFMAGRFDLVITDKAMPGMNGDQMAAAIKQRSPQTPIILLTGFGLFHEKKDFPDIDVLASKPVRIAVLREAIEAATPLS